MNIDVKKIVLLAIIVAASGCSSNDVKEEEYEYADSVRLLEIPPNLTRPDKKLELEIPKPSLRACEILKQADAEFKATESTKQ